MKRLAVFFSVLVAFSASAASKADTFTGKLVPLIHPAKLATLKTRGANPRIQKAVAIIEEANLAGCSIAVVVSNAVARAGYTNTLATLTRESLSRNHTIAGRLGVLTRAGLADMRLGKSPTIARGPYAGDELSVDHIVPRAVAPELDNVIANLGITAAPPQRIEEFYGWSTAARLRSQVACGGVAVRPAITRNS